MDKFVDGAPKVKINEKDIRKAETSSADLIKKAGFWKKQWEAWDAGHSTSSPDGNPYDYDYYSDDEGQYYDGPDFDNGFNYNDYDAEEGGEWGDWETCDGGTPVKSTGDFYPGTGALTSGGTYDTHFFGGTEDEPEFYTSDINLI